MIQHIVLGVIANILRAYTVYRFMELFYVSKGSRKKWHKLIVYSIFVILTSGGYYLFENTYINICTNIIGLLLITCLYKSSFLKRALIILCVYSVNIVVESLVFAAVGRKQDSSLIMESINECITSIGICLIVIVLEKTKAVKNNEIHVRISTWIALFSVPIISIAMVLVLLNRYENNTDSTEIEIIGILIINMVIFYLYGAIQDYYRQKIERDEFMNRMKAYSNQLDIMKKSHELFRELQHDMKHHLVELKYLSKIGATENVISYIADMEKHMINIDEFAYSGNKEIDSILNYLLQDAKQTLDKIQISIALPKELEIHNYMFNVIFGNLLENAIYAAKMSEKKILNVEIKNKQNLVYIKIENSFNGNIKFKNGILETTKTDIEDHGIGLKSVKRIIEEMNGMIEMTWEDDWFCVNVMFYQTQLCKNS